jgi:hypothetical protein
LVRFERADRAVTHARQAQTAQSLTAAGKAVKATLVEASLQLAKLPEGIFSGEAEAIFDWTAFHTAELPSLGEIYALTNLLVKDPAARCLRETLRLQLPNYPDGTPQHDTKSELSYRATTAFVSQKGLLAGAIHKLQRERGEQQMQRQKSLAAWSQSFDAAAVLRFSDALMLEVVALQAAAAHPQGLSAEFAAQEAFCRQAITWVLRCFTQLPMAELTGVKFGSRLHYLRVEPDELIDFAERAGLPHPVQMARELASSLQAAMQGLDSPVPQVQVLTVLRALSRMVDHLTAAAEPSGPGLYDAPEALQQLLAKILEVSKRGVYRTASSGPKDFAEARALLGELDELTKYVASHIDAAPTLYGAVQNMRAHARTLRSIEESLYTLASGFGVEDLGGLNTKAAGPAQLSVISLEALQQAMEVPRQAMLFATMDLVLPHHNNYPAILEWAQQAQRRLHAVSMLQQNTEGRRDATEGTRLPATMRRLQAHLEKIKQLSLELMAAPTPAARRVQNQSPKVHALAMELKDCVSSCEELPPALRRSTQLCGQSLARCRNLRVDELLALAAAMPHVAEAKHFLTLYAAAPPAQRHSMLACPPIHDLARAYSQLRAAPCVQQQTHLWRQAQQMQHHTAERVFGGWSARPDLGGTVHHLRDCANTLLRIDRLQRGFTRPLECRALLTHYCQRTAFSLACIAKDLGAPMDEFLQSFAGSRPASFRGSMDFSENLVRYRRDLKLWQDEHTHLERQAASPLVCDALAGLLGLANTVATGIDQLSVERLPLPYAPPAALVQQFQPMLAQLREEGEAVHGETVENAANCCRYLQSTAQACIDAAEPWQAMAIILSGKDVLLDVQKTLGPVNCELQAAPAARDTAMAPDAGGTPRRTHRNRRRTRQDSSAGAQLRSELLQPEYNAAQPMSPRLTLAASPACSEVDGEEDAYRTPSEPTVEAASAASAAFSASAAAPAVGRSALQAQASQPPVEPLVEPALAANGQRHLLEGNVRRTRRKQQAERHFVNLQAVLLGDAAAD